MSTQEQQTKPCGGASASLDGLAPCKFWTGSVVRHRKGTEYVIVETPQVCRIEAGNIPAYAYRERHYDPTGGNRMWVRPQAEMEDGRFDMIDGGPYADLYAPKP